MSNRQTDNSKLIEKVDLRMDIINRIDKDEISILDAFGGNGVVWDFIQRGTRKRLKVLRIDQKDDRKGIYLVGDNVKFLQTLDLSQFDIIDLDAYGVPFEQLNILFDRNYKGNVVCTVIQRGKGGLSYQFLEELGYTKAMLKKIHTLFSKNPLEKLLGWLNTRGIKEVYGYFFYRTYYFAFEM